MAVRDIVEAAGQRNSGSLHYYFGAKEELARELVADGAKLIDERRNRLLDELEREGGPHTLRELVEIMVWPSTNLGDDDGGDGEDTYIRFISMLQMSHQQLFMDALEGKWASGYNRCIAHFRAMMKDVDPEVVTQRLVFMSICLRALLSAREAALQGDRSHRFWGEDATMENLIDSLEGILNPSPSARTPASLRRQREARSSAPAKPAGGNAVDDVDDNDVGELDGDEKDVDRESGAIS